LCHFQRKTHLFDFSGFASLVFSKVNKPNKSRRNFDATKK